MTLLLLRRHRLPSQCVIRPYLALFPVLIAFEKTPVKSAVVKEDEAAAMAAIFSAQTQNWEETQEKMSQLVYPERAFCSRHVSNEYLFFACPPILAI